MNTTGAPTFISLIPFILIMVVFYFLIIMPQQNQQKKHRQMIEALKKNDDVVTIAGIHGTIVNVKDKTFILRVDDDVKIEIDKNAIASVKRIAAV